MLKYNPVVKNGRWEIKGFGHSLKCSAVDRAEAIYKFCSKYSLPIRTCSAHLETTVIRPTERRYK